MLYYTIVHQNTCSVPCPCKILSILSSCFELVIITSACTCSFTWQDRKKKNSMLDTQELFNKMFHIFWYTASVLFLSIRRSWHQILKNRMIHMCCPCHFSLNILLNLPTMVTLGRAICSQCREVQTGMNYIYEDKNP